MPENVVEDVSIATSRGTLPEDVVEDASTATLPEDVIEDVSIAAFRVEEVLLGFRVDDELVDILILFKRQLLLLRDRVEETWGSFNDRLVLLERTT